MFEGFGEFCDVGEAAVEGDDGSFDDVAGFAGEAGVGEFAFEWFWDGAFGEEFEEDYTERVEVGAGVYF